MKVLLLSTYDAMTPAPTLPLAIAYLKSYLINNGIETEAVDVCFIDERDSFLKEKLDAYKPDIVGLSIKYHYFEGSRTKTTQLEMVKLFVDTIKKHSNATIVLGGAGFSGAPEYFLRSSGAQYGIVGEGEVALHNFVKAVEQKVAPEDADIKGLIWENENHEYSYIEKVLIDDIRSFRTPDRSVFSRQYLERKWMIPVNGIQTCRGCSKECFMCNIHASEGNVERTDDPEKVVEQIKYDQQLGYKGFYIADTIFNRPVKHAHDVCDAFIKHNIKGPWSAAVVPTGLTVDLIEKMKATGCNLLTMGIDTADETLLKRWKKGFTVQSIIDAVENFKKANMVSVVTLCIGGPGETLETVKNTFDVIDSVNPDILLVYYGFMVFPKTELFDIALEEGLISGVEDLYSGTVFYDSKDISLVEFKEWYKNRYQSKIRIDVRNVDREIVSWYAPRANDIGPVVLG